MTARVVITGIGWSTRGTINRGYRKNRYFYRLLRIASGTNFP